MNAFVDAGAILSSCRRIALSGNRLVLSRLEMSRQRTGLSAKRLQSLKMSRLLQQCDKSWHMTPKRLRCVSSSVNTECGKRKRLCIPMKYNPGYVIDGIHYLSKAAEKRRVYGGSPGQREVATVDPLQKRKNRNP